MARRRAGSLHVGALVIGAFFGGRVAGATPDLAPPSASAAITNARVALPRDAPHPGLLAGGLAAAPAQSAIVLILSTDAVLQLAGLSLTPLGLSPRCDRRCAA